MQRPFIFHRILAILAITLSCACVQAVDENDHSKSSSLAFPKGWESWSPRAEIAPAFSLSHGTGKTGGDALRIETRDPSQFGAWKQRVDAGPGSYRFSAWYRVEHVTNELRSVITRLQWLDAKGH